MTIDEAVKQLISSEEFKLDAREDAKLRVFLGRYNKGEIKNGAAIDMLLKYGYTVEVKGRKKIVKRKD